MSFISLFALPLLLLNLASAAIFDTLSTDLQSISSKIFPDLRAIAQDVYDHPEIGRNETFAHGRVVEYFQTQNPGLWEVTPSVIPNLPTAWKLDFDHRPQSWSEDQPLPKIGFMSEYDALPGIGHACGHNLILLNGLLAANLVRQAVIDYDIAAHITLIGTPDEEEAAGKHDLEIAGVFDEIDVWMMAHPTVANAVQPMNCRHNVVVKIVQDTHYEAVKEAYQILVSVKGLAGTLPGISSTAVPVEDVGMFICNVIQTNINLGVIGVTLNDVIDAVQAIKEGNTGYSTTNFTAVEDDSTGGIAISFSGTGGHASGTSLGALDLSIDMFSQLSAAGNSLQWYLPHNTTSNELDFTVDIRTRYTSDLQEVGDFVTKAILTKNITFDLIYPALEVTPFLPDVFISTIAKPEYGSQNWSVPTTAPASTDASWVQQATVVMDGGNHTLVSSKRVVFHPNYSICEEPSPILCAFNHEPGFRVLAGADFAYAETEKIARALAEIAVRLLKDPWMMNNATAIIKR